MSYLIDWSQTSADGTTAVSNGAGGSIDVTVSTPANGNGSEFYVSNDPAWGDDGLRADAVSDPVNATITFSEGVENVTFELFDVDAGKCYDDKVTIIALDAMGNPVDVVFSNTASTHEISGNTISGSGAHSDGLTGSGAPDSVTVTVMGEIVSLQIIQDNGSSASRSGSIGVSDISFDAAAALDGIVEGTSGDDMIDVAYTGDPEGDMIDANDAVLGDVGSNDDIVEAGAGDDTVRAGEGDDTVYGGAGNDDLAGGNGNDVIFGDSGGRTGSTRESFEWDLAPDDDGTSIDNGDPITGFTQDTGNVEVTFSVVSTTGNSSSTFQNSPQQTAGIDGGDETVDADSSLSLTNNGTEDSGTYALDFSAGVENVQFRVNDVDNSGVIRVMAYDTDGNPIEVTLTGGSGVTLTDEDGVTGADTARSEGGNDPDASERFSVLVEIPGPVGRIEIVHEQDGPDNSGVNVTDVFFDAPTGAGAAGDDIISGGAGDDMLYGEDGDDTIDGGADNDTIRDSDGSDSVTGGTGDDDIDVSGSDPASDHFLFPSIPVDADPEDDRDFVDGGAGNDTIRTGDDRDTILGGQGDDSIMAGLDDDEIDAGDGNDYVDAGLGNDTVFGGAGDDTIIAGIDAFSDYVGDDPNLPAGQSDPNKEDGRDYVDGGAGNDYIETGDDRDTIRGGTGNDTINAGIDDDDVIGGDGDDLIIGSHGSDTILGGQGNDTIYGGYGPTTPPAGVRNEYPDDEGDPVPENGRDFIDGGAGNDVIFGEDDDDTLLGGAGNDYIDGGVDDDSIVGGAGSDTLIGGQGDDTIEGGADADLISGGTGNDLLNGGNGDDTIDGGAGNDTITGGADNDEIMGGDGDDAIVGGFGDDKIDGGAGNDTIEAGSGNDTVTAGDGDDSVVGGDGDDLINGGAGNDTLNGADDADTFTGLNAGDVVFGGAGFTPGVSTDFDTLDLTGSVSTGGGYRLEDVRTDSDGNGIDGTVVYTNSDGDETGRLTFENIEKIIPCFTPGTLIATPRGERLVEELREGDRIITRDNGIQEIRWVGEKRLSFTELTRQPHLQPVLIRKGALGHGLPERDMLVSPNHRMLVANDKTSLYFEEREVLVAAKHMVNGNGIQSVEALGVSYIHFMFDQHEVVLSDGAWTESFQPGDYTLNGIDEEQREEILGLFPELENHAGIEGYQSARRTLKRHEACLLVE